MYFKTAKIFFWFYFFTEDAIELGNMEDGDHSNTDDVKVLQG